MKDKSNILNSVKTLAKDMSIYGTSKIASQIIGFLLLPLYTSKLSPADYGILALIGLFSNGYAVFSNLGIGSAVFRFAGMTNIEEEKKKYLDTAQYSNIILNILVFSIAILFCNYFSSLLFNSKIYTNYIIIGALIGLTISISAIPLTYLRIQRKAIKVANTSIINLIVSILITFIGIVVLNWGIWGALVGNLAGNLVSLVYLYINVNTPKIFNLSTQKIKELAKYALPMFPHKVFCFALPIYSQVLLSKYLSLDDLGIYSIGMKFCLPLLLFTGLFQTAYSPFKYEILKNNSDSKNVFRQFNFMYVAITLTIYSFITIFGKDLIELFTNERFHTAAAYLWAIALIPISQGFYFIFGTGIEFAKSPKYIPLISGTGLLIVIITSPILIVEYGVIGAGIATSTGWAVMSSLMYFYSQSLYKIYYDWKKISILFIGTIIIQLLLIEYESIEFILKMLTFIGFVLLVISTTLTPLTTLLKVKTK